MAMTQEEIENFKRKARAYYGVDLAAGPVDRYGKQMHEYEPWRDIVGDYREKATSRYGPHGDYPGMTVNPDAFGYGDPLGLLSSKKDMDEVLGDVDYRAQLRGMDPEGRDLLGPVRPPMEMRTDGVPIGPQLQEFNPTPSYLASQRESVPWQQGFQNRINPNQPGRNQGLLDEFNQINPLWNSIDSTPQIPERKETFSQEFPGSEPDEDWRKQAWQKQPGLLEEQNMKDSGWMKDKRMKDSQKRDLGLAQMLLNFGQQQSQDDHEWQDW